MPFITSIQTTGMTISGSEPAARAKLKRQIIRAGMRPNNDRDGAFRRVIRSIPKGRVSTYGKVAAAAGYPLYHRAVARLLRVEGPTLPWHRIVGLGGEIKLPGEGAAEQRLRLQMEGVRFRGRRVDMERYEHPLRPWDAEKPVIRQPISTRGSSLNPDVVAQWERIEKQKTSRQSKFPRCLLETRTAGRGSISKCQLLAVRTKKRAPSSSITVS